MPYFECAKEFEFCAAHYNPEAPQGHHCARLHGHSWAVRLTFRGESCDSKAWLIDFGDIRKKFKPVVDALDHQNLNEILPFNPSAELLAKYFAETAYAVLQEELIASQVLVTRCDVTERCGDWKTWASYIL